MLLTYFVIKISKRYAVRSPAGGGNAPVSHSTVEEDEGSVCDSGTH